MKKVLLIIVAVVAAWVGLSGQGCSPSDFTTQGQIDSFAIHYPGCTETNTLGLSIVGSDITNLNGLAQLEVIGGALSIYNCPLLSDLTGLNNITAIKGELFIKNNPLLINLNPFQQLTSIGKHVIILSNTSLESISALDDVEIESPDATIYIKDDHSLTTISAFKNIDSLELIRISGCTKLEVINFEHLVSVKQNIIIENNPHLYTFGNFENLNYIGGSLSLQNSGLVENVDVFYHLLHVPNIEVYGNSSLNNLLGFQNLQDTIEDLSIGNNNSLVNLNGLENFSFAGYLSIQDNQMLESLSGLENLQSIATLYMSGNPKIANLDAISNIISIKSADISHNNILTNCAIAAICDRMVNSINQINFYNNGPSCESNNEVLDACTGRPVIASVYKDSNGDCNYDTMDVPIPAAVINLDAANQHSIRPTQANGQAKFKYRDTGTFSLSLPQFPNDNWAVCIDTIWINPDTFPDTIKTTFLLTPLTQCPDLSVDLGLPTFFRGCLATSPVQVKVTNLGTITAEDVQVAVVMPFAAMELVSSTPPVVAQNGDTLFFSVGDLPALEFTSVNLTVKTRCDTFLLDQSLCLEAFAGMSNPCPSTPLSFSEIRVYSECLSDTTVRFTLKNVGNAPTQALHEYVIIEDEVILKKNWFTLAPQESMIVDADADGSTFRLEATQFEDGTKTATAIENCGGLTPGFITAYWIDEGVKDYDFDCRRVVLAYDPNIKTAIPTGVGPEHLLAANRPIQYTIDFQNTGTDTAFRVLLRDVLSPNLDVNTFSPGFASHPYDWEIRDGNILDVTFSPIALPDSNVNEVASHGFFSYTIQQKNNLPYGTVIENSATIIFDFNPPIITNTVFHTIGELLVSAEEPQLYSQLWQIMNNPMKSSATFRAKEGIRGGKQFDLIDTGGRIMYSEKFYDQEFTFERGNFGGGMYFFRIVDDKGRVFSGKVVISE